jgi:NRPS condensation-like uncharacterized protein
MYEDAKLPAADTASSKLVAQNFGGLTLTLILMLHSCCDRTGNVEFLLSLAEFYVSSTQPG